MFQNVANIIRTGTTSFFIKYRKLSGTQETLEDNAGEGCMKKLLLCLSYYYLEVTVKVLELTEEK